MTLTILTLYRLMLTLLSCCTRYPADGCHRERLDKLWADYRSALEASGVHGSVAALKLEKGDTGEK